MANPGDEFIPAPLPDEKSPDYFKVLVFNCIKAFRITLSDSTALDANGVIGKLRVLILDDNYYKSETKKIRARKTIDDLSELSNIQRSLEYEDEEEPEEPEEEYDIRNPGSGEVKVKKPRKLFDKQQIDLKMKIFQAKRDLLSENRGEEEKEGDSINYFFVPITREEFERLRVAEVSEGSNENSDAYMAEDSDAVSAAVGKDPNAPSVGEFVDAGSVGKYEEVDGEMTLVLESK